MKNGKLLIMVLAGIVAIGVLCTGKTVTAPPVADAKFAIGNWKKVILPLLKIIPDTLTISMTIKSDSHFSLNLTKRTSTQLYTSEGTWTTIDDSIFLHSSKCLVIDTIPNPDSLKNLGDSLCSIPISLKLPVVDTSWIIEPIKLSGVLSGFPIPKDTLYIVLPALGKLEMKKVATE